MSYCLNPKCLNRLNPGDRLYCQSCGSSLLINGRYRVLRPLRELNLGAYTEVFEVKDFDLAEENWGSLKFLKVLKSSSDRDLVCLFQQEARALIWLRHSGIPRVEPDGYFKFFPKQSSQSLHCLVMEKIQGISLKNWLETNQLISENLTLNWLEQSIATLEKLHQNNIIHRDIKPSNLMLTPNGKLVLIDFGTVAIAESSLIKVGTIGYAAPEQMQGKAVLQSDFFALGRTFVHLLTGINPIYLPTDAKTGKLGWRNLASTLSKPLANLIDQLMAPLPEKRPKNTKIIRIRLQQFSLKDEEKNI